MNNEILSPQIIQLRDNVRYYVNAYFNQCRTPVKYRFIASQFNRSAKTAGANLKVLVSDDMTFYKQYGHHRGGMFVVPREPYRKFIDSMGADPDIEMKYWHAHGVTFMGWNDLATV